MLPLGALGRGARGVGAVLLCLLAACSGSGGSSPPSNAAGAVEAASVPIDGPADEDGEASDQPEPEAVSDDADDAQVLEEPGLAGRSKWVRVPAPEDFLGHYPDRAIGFTGEARVGLSCLVNALGRLFECVIDEENPPDLGFGAAAHEVSKLYARQPTMEDGRAVEGGLVRILVRFPSLVAPDQDVTAEEADDARDLPDELQPNGPQPVPPVQGALPPSTGWQRQ